MGGTSPATFLTGMGSQPTSHPLSPWSRPGAEPSTTPHSWAGRSEHHSPQGGCSRPGQGSRHLGWSELTPSKSRDSGGVGDKRATACPPAFCQHRFCPLPHLQRRDQQMLSPKPPESPARAPNSDKFPLPLRYDAGSPGTPSHKHHPHIHTLLQPRPRTQGPRCHAPPPGHRVPCPQAADGKREGICQGSSLLCKLPGAGGPDTKAKRPLIPWQAERGAGPERRWPQPPRACLHRPCHAGALPASHTRAPKAAGRSPARWPGRTPMRQVRRVIFTHQVLSCTGAEGRSMQGLSHTNLPLVREKGMATYSSILA